MFCKNRITLIGFLGQDAESRSTPNGTVFTRLSLATSMSWKEKGSNEYKTRTEWHRFIHLPFRGYWETLISPGFVQRGTSGFFVAAGDTEISTNTIVQ